MSRYLLPREVARILGISPTGVRWLVDTRRLRATRTPGGVRLISAADLERIKRERDANPPISLARQARARAAERFPEASRN
jgi:excisionase family DNA binding protein